jgi:electron transfer flavoprotein alpha subunit
MAVLVLADHDGKLVRKATLNTVAAAQKIGGDIHVLVVGNGCADAAKSASVVAGVAKVLHADAAQLGEELAENVAALLVSLAKGYSHILAPRRPVARTSCRAPRRCSIASRSRKSSRSSRPTPSCGRSTPATRWRR